MKYAANIAAALLGLLFIVFGLNHFLNFIPMGEQPPPDSPPGKFFGALFPTGYLTFVKVLEIVGGLLVAIPLTRNLGLLVLGPIVVNILCFHIFLAGAVPTDPVTLGICALCLFLLWAERKAFCGLVCRQPA